MKCVWTLLALAAARSAVSSAPGRRALVSVKAKTRINPELHPVSDQKFFDGARADYPTDGRPVVKDHFSWPFPEVQDSHDYEKDYVKDENGDGGEHKAQMAYDDLRMKLGKQQAELDDLKGRYEDAHSKVEEAQKKHEAAQKAAEDARRKADDAGEQEVKGPDGDVGSATGHVEAEINDLDKCKEQLRKAKEDLQKAIDERKAAMVAYETAKVEEDKAKTAQVAAVAEEKKFEAEVKEEDAEHKKASKTKEENEAILKQKEAELEEAAKRLRKHRDADGSARTPGQDGGVYRTGASTRSAAPVMVAFVALVAAHILA
jgi:hypothetical protein